VTIQNGLLRGALAGLGGGSSDHFAPELANGRGWRAIIAVAASGWGSDGVLIVTLSFVFLDALQLRI